MPAEFTIRRSRNIGGIPPKPLGWVYEWQPSQDVPFPAYKNNTVPAGTWVVYGTSLDMLRQMLRRRFGADAKITEEWKANGTQGNR